MVSGFRLVSVTLALNLAFVTLVGPLADALDVTGWQWSVGAVGVSLALGFAFLSYNAELYVDGVWHFGFLVFLLSIGVHVITGTGLTAGDAAAAEVVFVWLFAVGAVVVAFKNTVREQLQF
ncbi:hypothetical protein ACFFQF_05685 [Haladaptatus pallidirubidus]|uniref:SPW repeat-containing protein n=1 Tax=Haladaptatus pallidirubidus TaxID=1008152 RepID=A0AAV3UMA4_9EURY|nr:hypothetical protein [Haladaptatus pallidirubidus]